MYLCNKYFKWLYAININSAHHMNKIYDMIHDNNIISSSPLLVHHVEPTTPSLPDIVHVLAIYFYGALGTLCDLEAFVLAL